MAAALLASAAAPAALAQFSANIGTTAKSEYYRVPTPASVATPSPAAGNTTDPSRPTLVLGIFKTL